MSANLAKAVWARLTAECDSADAVYPMRLPPGADFPALVYQQITGPKDYTHNGEAGPHRTTWQVTAWGDTYAAAKELAVEAVAALSAWTETSGDHVTDAVAFVASEFDLYDTESEKFYVPIDVTILYQP
jgi:hypothetical protein